ncbi:MAG: phosphatase PAP2 family protein [bacterium]
MKTPLRWLILPLLLFLCLTPCLAAQSSFPLNEKETRENIHGLYDVNNRLHMEQIEEENLFFRRPFSTPEPPAATPAPSPTPLPPGTFLNKNPLKVLTIKRLFTFSDLYRQLSTPQLLGAAVATNYLLQNDRTLFNNLDRSMKTREWDTHSPKITDWGEGGLDLAFCGLFYLTGSKKAHEVAQMAAESVVLTGIQVHVLKRIFGFNRPHVSNPPPSTARLGYDMNYDAMPSGHSAAVFAMATVFGDAYKIGWLTYPMATLAALTRIKEHAHWPSDLLIGSLMGHLGARQIMADHGYIQIKHHSSSEPWGRLRVKIDGGIEQRWDDNASFSSDGSAAQTDQFGYLFLDTRAYMPMSSERTAPYSTILQAAYRTDRLIYDRIYRNNYQNYLLSARFSSRHAERLSSFLQADSRNITYEALEELDNPWAYAGSCRTDGIRGGLNLILSNSLAAGASFQYQYVGYGGFSGENSRVNQGDFSISSRPGRSLSFQAGFLIQDSRAENEIFTFSGSGLWGLLSQQVWKNGRLSAFSRLQNLDFSKNIVPDGSYRRDAVSSIGVTLDHEFSGHWSCRLNWNLRTSASNDPQFYYRRNLLSAGFTNRF